MNWLNLSIQTLDSENFIGSDPVERATWLCLLRYCIGQENGGVIQDCGDWSDRKWQQLVRVTMDEVVKPACALWDWECNSLTVWGYPADKENEVRINRENGKTGGRPRKEPKQNHPVNHVVSDCETERFGIAETERKGKEVERKEKEYPQTPKGAEVDIVVTKPSKTPTSTEALKIADLYNRRASTSWSDKEVRAFKKLLPFDADELDLVCRYESSEMRKGDEGKHRRDLSTFLNNYSGELDRARAWESKGPMKASDSFTPMFPGHRPGK